MRRADVRDALALGAAIALALPRFRGGKKVPPPTARMDAEDLLAAVFPDQVACAENLPGETRDSRSSAGAPDDRDCLNEAMDIEGFERLLRRTRERRSIKVVARDLTEPSPLALEVLSARPYAFLDDAPLEERRTQAVMSRRWLDPADGSGHRPARSARPSRGCASEAWPDAANADELHDALLWLTFSRAAEASAGRGWPALLEALAARRAYAFALRRRSLWIAAERLPLFQAI